ncbi:hypothetical protein PIB30_083233 [Stylosanthes scabra]|uniref:Uncharacterized protein n=1 Tax=Stylosanthes scabra TaxID=79078 RepID=A0ABU6TRP7_9FABA|nr:hypothetical protein [Stylosanthes scabra]
MCLLLRNHKVLEKAKEELDKKIEKERCINDSDINKLVYIQAIVKETLRLYPPAPLTTREFTENANLGGYHIEKGTILLTNVWKINTNPSVWSDWPEFKPEKFLTTHKDVDFKGHHFDLLPFGSGRRMCPGISFGVQIIHFILASFLYSFEISSMEHVDMTGTLGAVYAKATPLKIYSQNNTDHYGYIRRGSIPLSGTSSKPNHIACVRRAPKSLFGEVLLAHTHLSHKPPTFRLGTADYAGSPKPLEGTFLPLAPSVGTTST